MALVCRDARAAPASCAQYPVPWQPAAGAQATAQATLSTISPGATMTWNASEGTLAGVASSGLTYLVVNSLMGGVRFPIAFFGSFLIPGDAVWWGAASGLLTALAGSIVPAWAARNVQVAEVFAKVA